MRQSNALRSAIVMLLCLPLAVTLPGCGGGDDTDFSAPSGGLTFKPAAEQPAAGQPAVTPPAGQPTADKAATPKAGPAPKAPGSAGTTAQKAGQAKGKISLSFGKGKSKDGKDSGTPGVTEAGLAGMPPVKIVNGRNNRAFRDDEDGPDPTQWRTNKFQLHQFDQHYLKYPNKAAISETGELTAGIDRASGEILVFESRFGQIRAFFQLSKASPVGIAISQAAEQVLILDSEQQLHVFDVPDLKLFDFYARRDFLRQQLARKPLNLGEITVSRMLMSPSGKKLLIATEDGKVQIRTLDSRPSDKADWPPEAEFQAHEGEIFGIAMTSNESQLATTADDGSVKVWNAKSKELLAELPKVNVPAFAICPIEEGFAIGRATGTVEAWINPGQDSSEIKEYYDEYDIAITSLMVEPKKKLLVRGRMNGSTNLLNLSNGEVVLTRKPFQSAIIAQAPWPNKERLLALGLGGRYTSWHVPLLREKQRFGNDEGSTAINKPTNGFFVAGFAPSRIKKNAAVDDDDDDVSSRPEKQELALRDFRAGLKEIARGDGAALAALRKASEKDRAPLRKDIGDKPAEPAQDAKKLDLRFTQTINLDNFEPKAVRLALSASGETLVIARPPGPLDTGTIEAWDIPSGKLLRRWATDRRFETLRLVADGKWLIPLPVRQQARRLESIGYYDLRTGLSVGSPGDPQCVAVSGDGKIAIGFLGRYRESTEVAAIYEPQKMKQLATLKMFETKIPAMCFIGEEEVVLSIRERSRARLAVATVATEIEEKIVMHEEKKRVVPWINAGGLVDNELPGVRDIVALGDGGNLATNGQYENNDYRFAIWERKGEIYPGDKVKGVRNPKPFLRGAAQGACRMCTAGSGKLAVLTSDGAATVDTDDGKVLGDLKLERTDKVLLAPNGQWLVAGDEGGAIRLASPSSFDKSPREFRAHDGPVLTMAFSEGGKYLATLGEEGAVKVWELSKKLSTSKEKD